MLKKKEWERGAGVLLPISSLPSPYGIGTLGKEAHRFVDWLVKAGQKYWQVLPVGPTSFGDSPYQSFSAFAGNPYFIDLDALVEEGCLRKSDVDGMDWGRRKSKVDYELIFHQRFPVLKLAYYNSKYKDEKAYREFCRENQFWLEDYCLYMALKFHFDNKEWGLWEEDIRFRKREAVERYTRELKEEVDFWKFCQYQFFKQWKQLREYANGKDVKIIGDIPLYVSMDSADVWTHAELFELDEEKKPISVAGVPPDYFSEDGQLWGNPLYRWDVMELDGYDWWMKRMECSAKLYDAIRIDHFIGVVRYYAIPFGATTARVGEFRKGPSNKLTMRIKETLKDVPIIAEDLGIVIPGVRNLMKRTGWPGMKVLQFAFDGDVDNENLPHNFKTNNCVAYGGTHDNEPLMGYFGRMKKKELKFVLDYLGVADTDEIPSAILRLAYASVADTVIFQMQDILGLGDKARMNVPSTVGKNWKWRLKSGQLKDVDVKEIRKMVKLYGRAKVKL